MPSSTPRRAATFFILVTITLDMLALGMVIPVLPRLVLAFRGGDTAAASQMLGVFATMWALMQFVFSPVLGTLSDRFGRRPIVLISNFGLGLDYLLMAWAPSLGWLFAGRIVSGICAASISTSTAYIADVTPPEKRAASFGLLGAAFGLGFVLGPAVGGLLGQIGPRLPFWVAGGLSLTNGLYGLFVLPESLPPERRAPLNWRRANPLGTLGFLREHRQVFGLSAVTFLAQLAHQALPSVFVLYSGYRYGWGPRQVGLTLAGVGVCSAIVQGGLVRRIVPALGEAKTLVLGLVAGAIGFAIYGLAPTGAVFWLGVPVMSLWGLTDPAVQGLMTRRVGSSEQGRLQGAIGSLRGITGLIGPGLFTTTFAFVLGEGQNAPLPGAPFLVSSALLAIAALAARRVTSTTT